MLPMGGLVRSCSEPRCQHRSRRFQHRWPHLRHHSRHSRSHILRSRCARLVLLCCTNHCMVRREQVWEPTATTAGRRSQQQTNTTSFLISITPVCKVRLNGRLTFQPHKSTLRLLMCKRNMMIFFQRLHKGVVRRRFIVVGFVSKGVRPFRNPRV